MGVAVRWGRGRPKGRRDRPCWWDGLPSDPRGETCRTPRLSPRWLRSQRLTRGRAAGDGGQRGHSGESPTRMPHSQEELAQRNENSNRPANGVHRSIHIASLRTADPAGAPRPVRGPEATSTNAGAFSWRNRHHNPKGTGHRLHRPPGSRARPHSGPATQARVAVGHGSVHGSREAARRGRTRVELEKSTANADGPRGHRGGGGHRSQRGQAACRTGRPILTSTANLVR